MRRRPLVLLALVALAVVWLWWLGYGAALARPDYPRRTYATCYDLRGTMAYGGHTHFGVAASNYLPAGTGLWLDRPFRGRRRFVVHDTGRALSDGHLDLWAPDGCRQWGRRTVRYRLERTHR